MFGPFSNLPRGLMGFFGAKAGDFPNALAETLVGQIDVGPFLARTNGINQATNTVAVAGVGTVNFALGPNIGAPGHFIVGGAIQVTVPVSGRCLFHPVLCSFRGATPVQRDFGEKSDDDTIYTGYARTLVARIPYGWILLPDDEICAFVQVYDPAAGAINASLTYSYLPISI